MLHSMVPARAGDDGWSVIATFEAPDSALIMEGRPAPIEARSSEKALAI